MDYRWTPRPSYPKTLYRVVHQKQHIPFNRHYGWVASDRTSFYTSEHHMESFVSSLTAHRQQERIGTPYVSFFEDEEEAKEWCLAAQEVRGCSSWVVRLDMECQAMKDGFDSGHLVCWKLKDVVMTLGLQDTILGGGRGMGMADSEWLFLHFVPRTATLIWTRCDELRRPQTNYTANSKMCLWDGEGHSTMHGCLEKWGKEEVKLLCGCRNQEHCVHFDWNILGTGTNAAQTRVAARQAEEL